MVYCLAHRTIYTEKVETHSFPASTLDWSGGYPDHLHRGDVFGQLASEGPDRSGMYQTSQSATTISQFNSHMLMWQVWWPARPVTV
jgi:hypothetical protein